MLAWLKKPGRGTPRLAEDVRWVLGAAAERARELGHDAVGTEHVLLAAMAPGSGNGAAALLAELGLSGEGVAARLRAALPTGGGGARRGPLPYTSRVLRALQHAQAAAGEVGASPVTVEHLLIGLLREGEGVAARVLTAEGATAAAALAAVRRLDGAAGGAAAAPGPAAGLGLELDDGSNRSIYEQIIERVQEAVATGRLRAGERLPTVRRLADELDIAPGTVARAYRELERRSILATDGARGTRVAAQPGALVADAARPEALLALLRPVAIAGFHLGATAEELRGALDAAMSGIFDERSGGA